MELGGDWEGGFGRDGLAANFENFVLRTQGGQSVEGGFHDIGWIARPERLCEHVADSGGFDDRAHTAAGDDASSRRSWLEKNTTSTELTEDLMRNGVFVNGDIDHPFLRGLGGFADRLADFIGLAKADPNAAIVIARDDQRLKLNRRPPLTTLAQRLMKTTFSVVSLGSDLSKPSLDLE